LVVEVEMGRVGGTYGEKNEYRVLVWKPEGNTTLTDLGVEGTIILKWI
jgi:hypothetical protein